MTELVRILDPGALDVAGGRHGRMTIELSEEELGRPVTVAVPRRLVCARCDGGGCDGCDRSGALRLDVDDDARRTEVVLPREATGPLRIRLARPFDGATDLDLLTIEVRLIPATQAPKPWPYVLVALVLVALVLVALALRSLA